MMGLAVGKKAASYSPQTGTTSGEDVMKMFFGDDLGFTSMLPFPRGKKRREYLTDFAVCWNYLRLGEAPYKAHPLVHTDIENGKLADLSAQEPIRV